MSTPPEGPRSGQQILHYRLTEKLGEGGMGVVWKATDTTLDRPVAIKVLPAGFAADADRLARFEREARLLASLNHPNIATVYSVHVVEGVRYLSMELVPGEDLAQRVARGPLPVADALEIARQIALALETAHEHGVVHRDLKPANIRLTPDGRVKVLDFGLAKAMDSESRSAQLSHSPTHAVSAMTSGMIIGTAAYMSPEQARGMPADRRADIWAFGVVLFEMLTGARAFEGETVSDTLAAVLRAEPDRTLLPADLPPRVRTMLDRCLEKNARRRLRDIGEALLLLEDVQAGRGEVTTPAAPTAATAQRSLGWLPWAVAALALVAAVAGFLRPGPPPAPLRKYTLELQSSRQDLLVPTISPDGRRIAYFLDHRLWVRDLSLLDSRMLAEGVDEDFRPAWSPDGEHIAFVNPSGLARVSVAGGAVSPLCSIPDVSGGAGGSWSVDGHIYFARGHNHIYKIAAGGGVPTVAVARIDSLEADLHHPLVLPGQKAIACILHPLQGSPTTIVLASPGKRDTLLRVEGAAVSDLAWDSRGYLLFGRVGDGGGVWALPFSAERLKVTGEPFLVAPGGSAASVSRDGLLAYRMGGASFEHALAVIDRSGAVRDTLSAFRRGFWSLALSPDDRKVAVEIREAQESDVWLYDLERGSETRFAFGTGRQMDPHWSPDGRDVVYRDMSTMHIVSKPADGTREARPLVYGVAARITPDGRHLVYSMDPGSGATDIWYRSLDGAPDSVLVVGTPASENTPVPAPQAPYLAYVSDETSREEIYLRPYPRGEGRWQVSSNGGSRPFWSRTGDRLYYMTDDKVYEVGVQLTPDVRLGSPRELFDLKRLQLQEAGRHTMVPTADPDRFLTFITNSSSQKASTDAVVVENWPAEFARRK